MRLLTRLALGIREFLGAGLACWLPPIGLGNQGRQRQEGYIWCFNIDRCLLVHARHFETCAREVMLLFLHSLQQADEHDSSLMLFGECFKVLKLEDQDWSLHTIFTLLSNLRFKKERIWYFGCRGLGLRFSLSQGFHPYRWLWFLRPLSHESFGPSCLRQSSQPSPLLGAEAKLGRAKQPRKRQTDQPQHPRKRWRAGLLKLATCQPTHRQKDRARRTRVMLPACRGGTTK